MALHQRRLGRCVPSARWLLQGTAGMALPGPRGCPCIRGGWLRSQGDPPPRMLLPPPAPQPQPLFMPHRVGSPSWRSGSEASTVQQRSGARLAQAPRSLEVTQPPSSQPVEERPPPPATGPLMSLLAQSLGPAPSGDVIASPQRPSPLDLPSPDLSSPPPVACLTGRAHSSHPVSGASSSGGGGAGGTQSGAQSDCNRPRSYHCAASPQQLIESLSLSRAAILCRPSWEPLPRNVL